MYFFLLQKNKSLPVWTHGIIFVLRYANSGYNELDELFIMKLYLFVVKFADAQNKKIGKNGIEIDTDKQESPFKECNQLYN